MADDFYARLVKLERAVAKLQRAPRAAGATSPGGGGDVTQAELLVAIAELQEYARDQDAINLLEAATYTNTQIDEAGARHHAQYPSWLGPTFTIDHSLGDLVLTEITADAQVAAPINVDTDEAPFLTLILVQDDTGHGVFFDQSIPGGFTDPPAVDPTPGAVTVATFRYSGYSWVPLGGRNTTATIPRPAVSVTRLEGFGDGRSGQNTANSSQDHLTIGAEIGSDKEYCIWFRKGDPLVPSTDGYGCMASRNLPNGAWSETIIQDSPEFVNEIGTVFLDDHHVSQAVSDSHRALSMMVAEDGFAFVAGNTHSDPIRLLRSAVPEGEDGFLEEWVAPGLITPYGPGGARPSEAALRANQEWLTTYWSFLRHPKTGTGLVFYRDGVSGSSAGWVCDRYVPSGTPGVPGTWQRRGGVHFLTSIEWPSPSLHSWYPMHFAVHPTLDKIAMFGTFRYDFVPDNRGFYFAWLDGFFDGTTPSASKADGTVITANTATTPLTVSNIEEVFPTAPYMQDNSGGADVDILGRPHSYTLIPDLNPVGDAPWSLQRSHVWWTGSEWKIDLVTNVPSGFTNFDTGGGPNIWTRVPLFCHGTRTYMPVAPLTGGKQDSLRCYDVTDSDDIFEFTLEEGLRVYQGQLDTRALAERGELHMFRLPTGGALYDDNVQFQVIYTLDVDLNQIDKVAPGASVPRIRAIRNEHIGLIHLGDDPNHEGWGVRLHGTDWVTLTGALPITADLGGKLVFVRLHASFRSANVNYGGRARVRYVIGGQESQTATILFPTGTTEPRMLSTQWVPLPETSAHDVLDGNGTGFVQVVGRCEASAGTVWCDLATVELGIFENATGHWPEGRT